MIDPVRQLKQHLPIKHLSLSVLFALRLLFDKRTDISNLDQDIADLTHFPERITGSYRAEWESYVLRELITYLRRHNHTAPAIMIEKIMADVEYIQEHDSRYQAMLEIIKETHAVMMTENTRIFPTPWRQQIMSLMLPVITISNPNSHHEQD